MHAYRSLIPIAAVLWLAGCATQQPQTAEEFRQVIPGTFMAKTETFEVNRGWDDVAKTFQRKAPECLHVAVRTVSRTSTSYQVIVTDYKPTVVVTKQRAELHLQRHFRSGVVNVGKEPRGGYYVVVADVYPVSKNQTRLKVYMPSIGFDLVLQAIKGWASGNNLGCPDMTKL